MKPGHTKGAKWGVNEENPFSGIAPAILDNMGCKIGALLIGSRRERYLRRGRAGSRAGSMKSGSGGFYNSGGVVHSSHNHRDGVGLGPAPIDAGELGIDSLARSASC